MSSHVKQRVLVIDDDKDILDLLEYNLENEGYKVKKVHDSREALEVALEFKPDLVLLDIMMPDIDGIEVCRQMRLKQSLRNASILFLTARGEEYSEIAAFGVGGDDYIIKPIRPRALLVRIRATLDRNNTHGDRIQVGQLVIDRPSYSVYLGSKPLKLARKEFELLFYLASNPNQVINRELILAKIWGEDVQVLAVR